MSELNTEDYLEHVSDLQPAIEGLRLGEYSDLIDNEGHQYVDLMLDGVGSASIAVLGHLHEDQFAVDKNLALYALGNT